MGEIYANRPDLPCTCGAMCNCLVGTSPLNLFHLEFRLRVEYNEQGFMQVGNYYAVRRQLLLIEFMLMKLKTKADKYSSNLAETEICK